MTIRLVICGVLAAAATACSSADKESSVPRRTAYPRVETYDSVYTAANGIPLVMEINSSTVSVTTPKPDGTIWMDVSYPLYDAVVSFTFLPVTKTTISEVIANRQERIRRNIGNVEPDFKAFDSDGDYAVQLLYAPSVLATPVQFLAVNPDSPQWLVTGAAYFRQLPPTATADSLGPMSAVLYRDIMHSLKSLR